MRWSSMTKRITMNLTQIKAAYTTNLNEKLSYCFDSIETSMIQNFRHIEKGKCFTMLEMNVNRFSDDFDDDYRDDMIKRIKERYVENWDITYASKQKGRNSHNQFIFRYKGHPSDYAPNIVLKKVIVVETEEEEEKEPLDRTHMLDIRK